MFTGLIQAVGKVRSLNEGVLILDVASNAWKDAFQLGESIAVNGCCLTVTDFSDGLRFDLSPETLDRTSLGQLAQGSTVNLERALAIGDRLGGHIVQGHVDATGEFISKESSGNSIIYRFQVPESFDRYLIDKGSIALDGISLTVVKPAGGAFEVWVIPHTLEQTNLGAMAPGQKVNIEFDMMAKYAAKLVTGD